jgi:hypothetical protein
MKAKQLNDWLQVMASVGVVIGLMFVALDFLKSTGGKTDSAL